MPEEIVEDENAVDDDDNNDDDNNKLEEENENEITKPRASVIRDAMSITQSLEH